MPPLVQSDHCTEEYTDAGDVIDNADHAKYLYKDLSQDNEFEGPS